jgi:hypothetical protein
MDSVGGGVVRRIALLGEYNSGKSTLAFTFGKYVEKQGKTVGIANLDPGCKHLKYSPAFDMRDYYPLAKTMRQEKADEQTALKHVFSQASADKEFLKKLHSTAFDWLLLDVGAGAETFILSEASNFLRKCADAAIILADAQELSGKRDYVALGVMTALLEAKSLVKCIGAVNKIDLKQKPLGTLWDYHAHARKKTLENLAEKRVIEISALNRHGFKELWEAVK